MKYRSVNPPAITLVALTVAAALSGCRKDESAARPIAAPPSASPVQPAAADSAGAPSVPSLSTSVSTGNPSSAHQLVEGFFAIEDNAWRWTGKNFTVNLAVPANAKSAGATLRLKFVIPELAFAKYQSLAVSALVGSTAVPAQKFAKAGSHEFVAEIPAAAFASSSTPVAFSLDKSFRPEGGDVRELGVIANSIALVPK